jgi:diketogulonate reductase-like aldo/keto reductase
MKLVTPAIIYGTAWKESETQRLTELAIEQGFRAIDTANQRRHYVEAEVGIALANMISRGIVRREDLFLQTKFTFRGGQDHRLPYDPNAPIAGQVAQSFANSLMHLQTEILDSYLLHGPSQRTGLGPDDWEAWRAMEALVTAGRVRSIGISNVSLSQLRELCEGAQVRPRFVQNRCFAVDGWDRAIRCYCAEQGILYQGFSLLTANRHVLASYEIVQLAQHYKRPVASIIFQFATAIGIVPLTGTTRREHMCDDLQALGFEMTPSDVRMVEGLGVRLV